MKTIRKNLAIFMCFLLLMLSVSISAQAKRDATSDTFMTISDYSELCSFRDRVNDGETSLCAELVADITIPTDGSGNYLKWLPIEEYKGVFDGKDHTITGITVDPTSADIIASTIGGINYHQSFSQLRIMLPGYSGLSTGGGHFDYEDSVGFFASTCENAYVRNLKLVDCNIRGNTGVGALVGCNSGWIDHCEVNNTAVRGSHLVGGVCGTSLTGFGYEITENPYDYDYLFSKGAVTNTSTNSGTSVIGSDEVGGICGGDDYGVFENCVNRASVSTDGMGGKIGGIIGELIGLAYGCANYGSVSDKGAGTVNGAGGICGVAHEACEIENCYNAGTVAGVVNVGGIAGLVTESWDHLPDYYTSKLILNCYNDGVIQGNTCVGGIAGLVMGDQNNTGTYYTLGSRDNLYVTANTIWNCFNHGQIIGANSVGGIAGENCGIIQNCYTAVAANLIGVNNAGATVSNCYYENSGIAQDNTTTTAEVYAFNSQTMTVTTSVGLKTLKGMLNDWIGTNASFKHISYAFKMERNFKSWNDGFCVLVCGLAGNYPAFEDGSAFPDDDPPVPPVTEPSMLITDGRGLPGMDVTVKVRVNDNPGIVGTRILIGYDSSVLTLVSVSDCGLLGYGNSLMSNTLSANPYIIIWDDALANSDYCGNGDLATLTFHIDEHASASSTILGLTCDNSSTFNCNLDPVSFTATNGTIEIVNYVPADVDHDCAVTLRDAVYMRRALAGWSGYEVDETAADANGDGVFSLLDVTVTRRYLAGWDLSAFNYPICNN